MLYQALLTIPLLATSVLAGPTQTVKRDPSDKSGKATMQYACDDATVPNPGAAGGDGEGGDGFFTADLAYVDSDGKTWQATACINDGPYCVNCLIHGKDLNPLNVTGCSNPAGGSCSLKFRYSGYDFDTETKEPKCGHESNGVQAFSNTKTAICYFDAFDASPVTKTPAASLI